MGRYTGRVDPRIDKRTRGANVYYTVYWSDAVRLDKHSVRTTVPSQSGLHEIYFQRTGSPLLLLGRDSAYYGGLRGTLRGLIDSISPKSLHGHLLPKDGELFVRYALCESLDDMRDILFFFATQRVPFRNTDSAHSGRYRYVYVKESPDSVAVPK